MNLQSKIKEDVKKAMLARESDKVTTLRGIVNAMTRELDAQKRPVSDELSDEDTTKVLQRLVKQRKDAIEAFTQGNRPDLIESETKELHIILAYLPEMMSKEDIKKVAEAKKAELGVTEKSKAGPLMAAIMKELKGKANGTDVKEVVDSLF